MKNKSNNGTTLPPISKRPLLRNSSDVNVHRKPLNFTNNRNLFDYESDDATSRGRKQPVNFNEVRKKI